MSVIFGTKEEKQRKKKAKVEVIGCCDGKRVKIVKIYTIWEPIVHLSSKGNAIILIIM